MANIKKGAETSQWKGGRPKTKFGYIRLKVRGPYRDKLEHRVVIHKLICEQRRNAIAMLIQTDPQLTDQFLGLLDMLEGPGEVPKFALGLEWEVHHCDLRRDHNCPSNLMRLDGALHAGIQGGDYWKRKRAWDRVAPRSSGEVEGEVGEVGEGEKRTARDERYNERPDERDET